MYFVVSLSFFIPAFSFVTILEDSKELIWLFLDRGVGLGYMGQSSEQLYRNEVMVLRGLWLSLVQKVEREGRNFMMQQLK